MSRHRGHSHTMWGPRVVTSRHLPPSKPVNHSLRVWRWGIFWVDQVLSTTVWLYASVEVQLFANKVCNLRSYAIKAGVRDTEPQARGNTRTFVWIGSGVTPLKWPQQPKSHNPRIVAVHNSAISNQFLLPTEPSTDIEQTRGIIHSWSDDGGGWAGPGTRGNTAPADQMELRWGWHVVIETRHIHRESDFLLRLIKTFLSFNEKNSKFKSAKVRIQKYTNWIRLEEGCKAGS